MRHNPLAFHLKCLTTDSETGRLELDNLIKREIDAREWFVFCENPLVHSEWVDMEQAHIIDSGKEMVWSIDMALEENQIIEKVRRICKDIEVYISYSRYDRKIADVLTELLVEKDYSVWITESMIMMGQNFKDEIEYAINRCSYEGFFILLVTENSVNLGWIEHEIGLAILHGSGKRIIPILVGNVKLPVQYEKYWNQYYTVPKQPCKKDFLPILKEMERRLKYCISGTCKKVE